MSTAPTAFFTAAGAIIPSTNGGIKVDSADGVDTILYPSFSLFDSATPSSLVQPYVLYSVCVIFLITV